MTTTQPLPEAADSASTELSLSDHLRDLHRRLIRSLIALAVAMLVAAPFYDRLLQILISPLDEVPQALAPTEAFVVALKVIFVIGLTLAMPVILYQALAFLLPALTKREKLQLLLFLPLGVGLFVLGLLFGAYIAVPAALGWLQSFGGVWVEDKYRLTEYISFVTTLLLALGVGFQTPLVVFFITRLGIVDYATLRKNIRWAFLVAAIVAALLTPTPDPYNMLVVMVPLFILYLLGVFMARWA